MYNSQFPPKSNLKLRFVVFKPEKVHDTAGKQTLFSINNWGAGDGADIGIGNSDGPHRDWTFSSNAASYSAKSLKVYVGHKQQPQTD